MSNFMENGPSNHNGETEQVWERPWTLEEMQKSSTNWSLAADSGLLHFLQDFSQRMLSKTHEIEKQLDGLIRDTKATDSCLHTVFNDFLMLSNTQFIENRVYDEEVEDPAPKPETVEKQPEQEKTREQKEAELIPKVQEAVNYGLKVLESAFEQLDIKAGNSESEDEEALEKVEPILEAKDLYVDRPLPYLIGSQAFMDQDDVGLGDLSSDEMSIDSDRDSVIESEDGEADESDEDFDQDEEVHGHFKKKPSVVSYDDGDEENEDEDSDIFGESDKDEDEIKDTGLPSFADELAARIKGETPSKQDPDRTSMSSGPSVPQTKNKTKKETKLQVEDDQDEMFKPPKMEDEEYSPFGGKGGLFSGGKGLFDDDDDEGDLFSDAPKTEHAERERIVAQTAEPSKTKKIPTGAVSLFPENSLFGSPNDSDSLESKEDKSPAKPKIQTAPKHAPVGGGLFDDDDDEDDFFSGKTLLKSTPVAKEKQMPKKTVDLFGEAEKDEDDDDDGDGTMFSGKSSAVSPQQDKRAEGEEETRPPEKKLPAGAVSMFGPGTKNILVEGLKKRKTSTSEESTKSEESVPPPEAVKSSPVLDTSVKAQNKSLFSDDEDSQIFPNVTKSKSKPTPQSKPSKAPLSIFDDEEEEDLFSSAPKSNSVQVKKQSLQPKKPVSSTLFSDDEDQWMSSKPSKGSPEVKPGGMKSSISAPSRLPSVNASQKDGLFGDDDHLFAATKESSKKSSQRASLLFEDEGDDEDKELLFGFKPSVNKTSSEPKASGAPSLFEPTEEEIVPRTASVKTADEKKSVEKKPVVSVPPTNDSTEIKKKPVGAVSLFGGIDILGNKQETSKKQNNRQEELSDDEGLYKEGPPPMDSKGTKAQKTALSLFDDDDDADEDSGEIVSFKTSKPAEKNVLMDHGTRIKSTGVFQDEELLFSHTQQMDNDPDVDLFATSAKASVPSRSSVKPVAPTLFGEDDDDDLFGSSKPKAPPKVPEKPSKPIKDEIDKSTLTSNKEPTSPLKSKKSSSRIGELKASLAVNPASLLPGAVPRIPEAVSVIPGLAPSSLPAAARTHPAADNILDRQTSSEGGVSFDTPAQVNTLENANKGRTKGAVRRRPQTRTARHLAAQQSEEAVGEDHYDSSSTQAEKSDMAASLPTLNPVSPRPSALTIPVTTPAAARIPDEAVRPKKLLDAEDDLFDSDDLFATASFTKPPASSKHKAKPLEEGHKKMSKTEAVITTKKDQASSIFDSHGDDLFSTVKQKPVQKTKPMSFLDDDDDIFGAGKSTEKPKMEISADIFQDKVDEHPKAQKKPNDVSLDASLFDDDVDIFADLTTTTKPKEKKARKKVETKSIFDDDMDDIFSTGTTKPTVKPPSKLKKNQSAQDPSSAAETGHSNFDDPLNAFGGN